MSKALAYQVLGLTHEVSKEEIKRAYRKMALQYHPDRNTSKEAAAKFIEINQAYDMLMQDHTDYQLYLEMLRQQYQKQAEADRIYKQRLYQILKEREEEMRQQNDKVENDIKFYSLLIAVILALIYTIVNLIVKW